MKEQLDRIRERSWLNREMIKYLAIVAMTLNHVAHVLLESGTLLYEVFIDIGYFTAITMCYLLAEGYQKTRSRRNYAMRLAVCAVISQPPFYLATKMPLLNMMFTLLCCFGILYVYDTIPDSPKRYICVFSLCGISLLCDWQGAIPAASVWFARQGIKDRKKALVGFGAFAVILTVQELMDGLTAGSAYDFVSAVVLLLRSVLSSTAVWVSAVLLLVFYNGNRAEKG